MATTPAPRASSPNGLNLHLHEATRKNNKEEVKRLLGFMSPDLRDALRQTPLHLACHEKNFEIIKMLVAKKATINVQDKSGWTPLHNSANAGDFRSCEFLLRQDGVDVTQTNNDGTTVLHYIVRHEAPSKPEERKLYKTVLNLLIERGAEVNAQTRHGEAPIHQACLKGNREAAKFLLKHNANVNIANKLGETGLHYAVRCLYKNPSVVAVLMKYGANPLLKSREGTPIDIAPPELVPVLTKANQSTNDESTALQALVGKTLNLKIVRATLKVETDLASSGSSAPFTDVSIRVNYGSKEFVTAPKPGTLSPQWNESFSVTILPDTSEPIRLSLMDRREPEPVGSVVVRLKALVHLTTPQIVHKAAYTIKRKKSGRISGKLRVQFNVVAPSNSLGSSSGSTPKPLTHSHERDLDAEPASASASSSGSANSVSLSNSSTSTPLSSSRGGGSAIRRKTVILGYTRGRCMKSSCDCELYVGDSGGGPCMNCGHYPAKHEKTSDGKGENSGSMEDFFVNPDGTLSPMESTTSRIVAQPQQQQQQKSQRGRLFNDDELTHSWEIKSEELKFIKCLGEGTSARVYKGRFREQEVAIKVLKLGGTETKSTEDFKKEFSIMSSLRSPNVVFFYGLVMQPSLCLVLEYCTRGSLYDVLNSKYEVITWPKMLKIFSDTVKGLSCLHYWKPQILHRDMKSLNLLVDDNWVTKVSDFGLSRFNTGGQISMHTLTKLRGTLSYTAPEVYFGEKFTPKADIFALGIIFWECAIRCITGKYHSPYAEFHQIQYDFQIIIQTAKNNLRPTIPPNCPPLLVSLMTSCWHQYADQRPTAGEVLEALQLLNAEYEAHRKEWDELCYQTSSNPPEHDFFDTLLNPQLQPVDVAALTPSFDNTLMSISDEQQLDLYQTINLLSGVTSAGGHTPYNSSASSSASTPISSLANSATGVTTSHFPASSTTSGSNLSNFAYSTTPVSTPPILSPTILSPRTPSLASSPPAEAPTSPTSKGLIPIPAATSNITLSELAMSQEETIVVAMSSTTVVSLDNKG